MPQASSPQCARLTGTPLPVLRAGIIYWTLRTKYYFSLNAMVYQRGYAAGPALRHSETVVSARGAFHAWMQLNRDGRGCEQQASVHHYKAIHVNQAAWVQHA